jgi:hypothetical protein
MDNKYWFFTYVSMGTNTYNHFDSTVSTTHPLKWLRDINNRSMNESAWGGRHYALIAYKEITKDEALLFNTVN